MMEQGPKNKLPRPDPKISSRKMTVDYSPEFWPELGIDKITDTVIHFPGFYLLHESGPMEGACWCQPEVIATHLRWDEDEAAEYSPIYVHRTEII